MLRKLLIKQQPGTQSVLLVLACGIRSLLFPLHHGLENALHAAGKAQGTDLKTAARTPWGSSYGSHVADLPKRYNKMWVIDHLLYR